MLQRPCTWRYLCRLVSAKYFLMSTFNGRKQHFSILNNYYPNKLVLIVSFYPRLSIVLQQCFFKMYLVVAVANIARWAVLTMLNLMEPELRKAYLAFRFSRLSTNYDVCNSLDFASCCFWAFYSPYDWILFVLDRQKIPDIVLRQKLLRMSSAEMTLILRALIISYLIFLGLSTLSTTQFSGE